MVEWKFHVFLQVLATERMVLSPDPRITVSVDRDAFSLSIRDITHQDKGQYVCQERDKFTKTIQE